MFLFLDLYNIFIRYNCYIILFNLLPMYPLDGFKILNSLLEIFLSFKKSIKLSLVLSLVCIIFMVSGIQLFCMGIMGEYMAKTYLETKNRPIYIVKESSDNFY